MSKIHANSGKTLLEPINEEISGDCKYHVVYISSAFPTGFIVFTFSKQNIIFGSEHEEYGGVYVVMDDKEGGKITVEHSNDTLETILTDLSTLDIDDVSNHSSSTEVTVNKSKLYSASLKPDCNQFIRSQTQKLCYACKDIARKFVTCKTSDRPAIEPVHIKKCNGGFATPSLQKNLHDFRNCSCQDVRLKDVPFDIKTFTIGQVTTFVIDPQGLWHLLWLTVVTIAFLYNCVVIPLRNTFPYQTAENTIYWFISDYSMDIIYILDVFVFKPRIKYYDDGFWMQHPEFTKEHYRKKFQYKMDLLSLFPLDLLYFIYGTQCSYFRLPRLLKIQTFWQFYYHLDNLTSSPYSVRVARTLTYMLYLIHVNACAYYAVSVYEGLGSNKWVYNGQGNPYIRCFYKATKTATSIGKNPQPTNEIEYLFMTWSWLMGVFVFAILIGQIRDIIATASKSQAEYRKMVDETLEYLRKLNVPIECINRVEKWFSFTWEQQHTLDESRVLDTLPHKMKTDVAINVHMKILNKVELFEGCEEALLRELVVKLRPVLYLPGDYICRKGEVGKEMYIVKTGQVQVVVGDENNVKVLGTLTEGSVFGEISLLNLSGTNRRTASVRSHGFSSIFVLTKTDLNEALENYPNAQEILKKKARHLIRQHVLRKNSYIPEDIFVENDGEAQYPKYNVNRFRKHSYRRMKQKCLNLNLNKRTTPFSSLRRNSSNYKELSKPAEQFVCPTNIGYEFLL